MSKDVDEVVEGEGVLGNQKLRRRIEKETAERKYVGRTEPHVIEDAQKNMVVRAYDAKGGLVDEES